VSEEDIWILRNLKNEKRVRMKDKWYEFYKGYEHNQYESGKGYYNIETNKRGRNKKKLFDFSPFERFQFREFDDLVIENKFGYEWVDKIGYFLSLIYLKQKVTKSWDRRREGYWIPQRLIQLLFPNNNHIWILECLEDEGVIEYYHKEILGKVTPRGSGYNMFRLSDEMIDSEIQQREILHPMLCRSLSRYDGKIDLEKELEYQKSVIGRVEFPMFTDDDIYFNEMRLNSSQSYSKDDFGGRFYTPFNRLSKSLREKCSLDGERLIEYDMRCSHFSILWMIWNQIDKGLEVPFISKEQNKLLKKRDIGRDWMELFEDCFIGESDLYKMMSWRLKTFHTEENRKVLKSELIRDLNSPLQISSEVLGFDREEFRDKIYLDGKIWIEYVKSIQLYDKYRGGYFKNLPQLLVSIEVGVMSELWSLLKTDNIDYLSVFDCVFIKEGDIQKVERGIKRIERKYRGIRLDRKG
jgi:hypothetical protein